MHHKLALLAPVLSVLQVVLGADPSLLLRGGPAEDRARVLVQGDLPASDTSGVGSGTVQLEDKCVCAVRGREWKPVGVPWKRVEKGRTISQPSSGGAYSGGGGTYAGARILLPDDGGATGVSFAASVIGFHGIIIGAGARVSPETLTKDPMLRALTAAAKESAAVVIEEESVAVVDLMTVGGGTRNTHNKVSYLI